MGILPLPGKFDVTRSSDVRGTVNGLWPVLTDVPAWTRFFRSRDGKEGLARVEELSNPPGTVDPLQPELGKRYRMAFTNGLEAEFKVTYWIHPAQISLGMVKETRKGGEGLDGLILDVDLFRVGDDVTKLWFGATVLLEKGYRPSRLARWPKRDLQSWVDGFHEHFGRDAPGLGGGARTKKEVAQARGPSGP